MSVHAPPIADAPLAAALADELVMASQLLAELAYDLGSDANTLRRHMTSLQAIDRVTQAQLAIAQVLRAGAGSLADVPLEDMAERLRLATGS